MDNIYIIRYESLQMVSEPIIDFDVGVCLTPWEIYVYLILQSHSI